MFFLGEVNATTNNIEGDSLTEEVNYEGSYAPNTLLMYSDVLRLHLIGCVNLLPYQFSSICRELKCFGCRLLRQSVVGLRA